MFCLRMFCPSGHFVPPDIFYMYVWTFGLHKRLVFRTFCPAGHFVLPDVLFWTFCPSGRFVPQMFCLRLLWLWTLCLRTLCLWTFCPSGRFVWAPLSLLDLKCTLTSDFFFLFYCFLSNCLQIRKNYLRII
jgi:hypothetical protein